MTINRIRARLVDALRALALGLLSFGGAIPLLLFVIVAVAMIPVLGIGLFLVPPVMGSVRALANQRRALAAQWSGIDIQIPYRREPNPVSTNELTASWQRTRWILGDPATWRDVLWMVSAPVNLALGLLPAALLAAGIEGLVLTPLLIPGYRAGTNWFALVPAGGWVAIAQVLIVLPLGLFLAPVLLRLHQRFASRLLSPTPNAILNRRVENLTASRAQVVGGQAEELRRIERDLHDGAQARLVALSMNLGMADDLFETQPKRARQLLVEAHQSSQRALQELRGLVRGIQPPVLTERGLAEAIAAIAFTLPIPVQVHVAGVERLPDAVESAAYFAVAECLANVIKHGSATSASVDIRAIAGRMRLTVIDDGVGGADPRRGTGLSGVARRLDAFDGTLTVVSPDGGPTVVTMEVPCASSSPKTTPSSATG